MRIINKIVNAYTTPEQRKIIKQIGAPAYNAIMKTSVGKTLRDAKNFYTSNVKPVFAAIEANNSTKPVDIKKIDPNKPTVLKAAPKPTFKSNIQDYLSDLGRNDDVGLKARQQLGFFLISLGTPAPEAQLFEKTLSLLAKTKGAQAAVALGRKLLTTSKVIPKLLTTTKTAPKLLTAAERKQVTAEVRRLISKARTDLVKTNPRANALVNKGVKFMNTTNV